MNIDCAVACGVNESSKLFIIANRFEYITICMVAEKRVINKNYWGHSWDQDV